jgi:hypothetical protein
MEKIIPTLREKRFLIIWLGICLFALFLNLADIQGKIESKDGKYQYLFFFSSEMYGHLYDNDFYPFTDFVVERSVLYPSEKLRDYYIGKGTYLRFNGIFNSFNLPEFIFYSLLGLGIVFIPKIWK